MNSHDNSEPAWGKSRVELISSVVSSSVYTYSFSKFLKLANALSGRVVIAFEDNSLQKCKGLLEKPRKALKDQNSRHKPILTHV